MHSIGRRTIGLNFSNEGSEFRLWSPFAEKVEIVINDAAAFECIRADRGYWSVRSNKIQLGDKYLVRLDR